VAKWCRFTSGTEAQVGLWKDALIHPVSVDRIPLRTLSAIVSGDLDSTSVELGAPHPAASAQLLEPFGAYPRNIFCIGKNYREHAAEFAASGYDSTASGAADVVPDFPIVFSKPATSVIGPDDLIDPHAELTSELDYEAELAVVIGRGGRGISKADALDHVFGYTIVNDVTARDLQRKHRQWLIGKGLDTFCPIGPSVITADEVVATELVVECRVNGEVRQKQSVADLIFDIPTLIEAISAGITLVPGDIIATGTPAGVGIGFKPPKFLRSGDEVTVTIAPIGTLSNRVR
jgi:2-keto-4-pentenoate hydratase/2-oxohepta-3-ene-1,7-dioic acid hydratase in catechol pathway